MISANKNKKLAESTSELNIPLDPSEHAFKSITDSIQFSDANQNILSEILKPFWNEIDAATKDTTNDLFNREESKLGLEKVKHEIIKIISQKENFCKENEVLKDYQIAFSQLNGQNIALKERIQELENSIHTDQNEGSLIPENLIGNENVINSISDIDRSSPDGQEIDNECLSLPCQNIELKNGDNIYLEEKIKSLETDKSSLETDRKELLENHK